MPVRKKTPMRTAKAKRLPSKGKVHASRTKKSKPTPRAIVATPQTSPPPTVKKQVTISAAKGRPMLTWVGKRPLHSINPFPGQHVETFAVPNAEKVLRSNLETWKDWPAGYPQGGVLLHGDNKQVLAHLLANGFRGKIQLIYIDPPFDSGADYVRKVALRGSEGSIKYSGESYTLGEQLQYEDIWANDNYLQFMFERLLLMRELLAENGSLWLHCDWHKSHQLRMLAEEVFGPDNFRNEIIWSYPGREMHIENKFNAKHDTLLFFARSASTKVNMKEVAIEYDREERIKGLRRKIHKDDDGREWVWETRGQAGGEKPYKRYIDEIMESGRALNDVWEDIPFLRGNHPERTGFPTQKPEALIERILLACSKPGDIVLDCFIGSGSTAAIAQKLGRRWVGSDINKAAIQTSAKRIQGIMLEEAKYLKISGKQEELLLGDSANGEESLPPVQLLFTHWRVNDYDLAIEHNEAVNLACEHIGVTRTLSDSFFDGTLGHKLVKIIPFGHPLSLTDLEDIRAKIESRPNDSRDVVVVCLGKELGVEAWLTSWNRMRKQGNTPNKIEVIELRTDPKYGKFFAHKPAQARVKMSRSNGQLTIDVQDFISPTILERLQEQAGPLLAPKITDWRAMVDSVMIDPAYDGKVFNVAFADVPERKQDLVQGRYELSAPKDKTVVAVKVTDMLGEEVLVQEKV